MMEITQERIARSRTVALTMLVALAVLTLLLAAPTAWGHPDKGQSPPPYERSGETGMPDDTPGLSSSTLLQKAEREGSVRVIVGLQTDFTPEGRLTQLQAEDQREVIESAGEGLRAELAGTGYQTLREYDTVPYLALSLTPEALQAVQDSPRATTIQEDVAVPADLADSAPKFRPRPCGRTTSPEPARPSLCSTPVWTAFIRS